MTSLIRTICIVAACLIGTGCVTQASYFPDSSSGGGGSNSVGGLVSISWVAPTSRVDNSTLSLSEIAGYRVYRGTDPDNLVLLKDTTDPSITNLNITETQPGTYYYAVTTYDTNGLESNYSEVVSKTVV